MARIRQKPKSNCGVDTIEILMAWPCVPDALAASLLNLLPRGAWRDVLEKQRLAWIERGRPEAHVLYREEREREAKRVAVARVRGRELGEREKAARSAKSREAP